MDPNIDEDIRVDEDVIGSTKLCDFPDQILGRILSFLPTEEAAATGVLSKRWSHLWKSLKNLIFKNDERLSQFCYMTRPELHNMSHGYVQRVNSVLANHTAPSIDQFIICFELDARFSTSLDHWVHFAMKKDVKKLVLDLLLTHSVTFQDSYVFPHQMLGICDSSSTLAFHPKFPRRCRHCIAMDLDHECPNCSDPPCPQCLLGLDVEILPSLENVEYTAPMFYSLQVLKFANVDLNDQVLEYFLSNCPSLEMLSVSQTTNLRHIRVLHNTVLKHLIIKNCLLLESVMIVCSGIQSLLYQGHKIELVVRHVPRLRNVSLNQTVLGTDDIWMIASDQLSSCLMQLETLALDIQFHGFMVYNIDNIYPKSPLPNLKTLELIVLADDFYSLLRLDTFLGMSPSLHKLVLKLQYYPNKGRLIMGAGRRHDLLEVVEIQGYRACKKADKLLLYLVKNAVALRQIILDPTMRWLTHPSGADKSIYSVREEARAREYALKLKEEMPSSIEIICL